MYTFLAMTARPVYSCAFPPSPHVVEYARVAEELGYHRIWLFDSPALYTDVWVALARIAEKTDRIGIGTGVAIPSMRHPVVSASAIATIEEISPGRLVAAFGTGYTGRLTMGQKPMKWADLARYVRQLRALLAGDTVEIDGGACQLMYSPGFGPDRPITTPVWVAPSGPKGFSTAQDLDVPGVLVPAGMATAEQLAPYEEAVALVFGTVVRPGEDHTSRRLIEAAGPTYTSSFHNIIEFAPDALDHFPGGKEWREDIYAERPEGERHLAIHEGHLCYVTDRDRPLVDVAGEAILQQGWTGDAQSVAARFDEAGATGFTEVLYGAAGPDIPGELEAFAAAATS